MEPQIRKSGFCSSERWREVGGLFRDPRIQGMTWQWWVFFFPLIYPRLLARKAHKLGTSVGTKSQEKFSLSCQKTGKGSPARQKLFDNGGPTPGKHQARNCVTPLPSQKHRKRWVQDLDFVRDWSSGYSPHPPCWSGAQGSQVGSLDSYPSCSDEATFSIPLPHCSVEPAQGNLHFQPRLLKSGFSYPTSGKGEES